MATSPEAEYRAVLTDLGAAVRRLRQDCPPMETARVLLAYDGPGQALVGLRHDGDRAVYFDDVDGAALGVPFDADGLDDRGGVRVARVRSTVEAARWAEKMNHYWGWRHPRFG